MSESSISYGPVTPTILNRNVDNFELVLMRVESLMARFNMAIICDLLPASTSAFVVYPTKTSTVTVTLLAVVRV